MVKMVSHTGIEPVTP